MYRRGRMRIKTWQYISTLFIFLLLILCGMQQVNNLDISKNDISTSLSYLEDPSGSLTLEQILSNQNTGAYTKNKNAFLTFGHNHSAWWVKLDVQILKDDKEDFVISANNPSIQYITAYIPVEGENSYVREQSGWGVNSGDVGTAAYQTPVFIIPEQFDKDRAIYLRIQSIYPHNYEVRILEENQFYGLKQQNLIFIGILLGTFITMALLNRVIYTFFREKTYIYYVLYQVAMFAFQFVSMGMNNLFMHPIAYMTEMNQSLFNCLMLLTSLVFVKAFLNTRKNTPKHHFAINSLIAALLGNILLLFGGWRFEANIITDCLGNITAALTLSVAILCVHKKINQAKYFLIAWSVLIMGGIVFTLRNFGILPNTYIIQHFMLIAAVGEALLIFTALVDRAKVLWEEKYLALKLFHEAEENRKKAEISFLRAQIKPHFLYNALSVIAALTVKKPQRAKELLYHLSDYLRGSFCFENNNGMTMLSGELETIKAYLVIEKERFRDKLTVEYEIDDLVNLSIPLLSIQPLVENALRHGLFKRPEGGIIRISVKKQGNYMMIQVLDNGVGIPEEILNKILNQDNGVTGIGLRNINERLMLHYGQGLKIESGKDWGTSVTLRIPIEEGIEL